MTEYMPDKKVDGMAYRFTHCELCGEERYCVFINSGANFYCTPCDDCLIARKYKEKFSIEKKQYAWKKEKERIWERVLGKKRRRKLEND